VSIGEKKAKRGRKKREDKSQMLLIFRLLQKYIQIAIFVYSNQVKKITNKTPFYHEKIRTNSA
jgi:hypothetical protein